MSISKFINVPVFIVSLVIGLLMVYLTMQETRKIYVYPTPETVDILQYRDKTGNCFSFSQKEVPCPKNEKLISKIPMQT